MKRRAIRFSTFVSVAITGAILGCGLSGAQDSRPRAREAGVVVGILHPGPLNAITDVVGVAVGHATLIRGDEVRTGVTAILPHEGNLFREKVPGSRSSDDTMLFSRLEILKRQMLFSAMLSSMRLRFEI